MSFGALLRRSIEAKICASASQSAWEMQTVCISHADCEPDAQILANLLRRSAKPPKEILTVDYEPVTGSHVGPGALALFFLSDDNVRNI